MCDIPATRKVCGFAGHNACHGCFKCLKQFPSDVFPNKLDYSGYERDTWEHRTAVNYKVQAQKYMKARTKSAQKEVVSEYGIRFSILTHFSILTLILFECILWIQCITYCSVHQNT